MKQIKPNKKNTPPYFSNYFVTFLKCYIFVEYKLGVIPESLRMIPLRSFLVSYRQLTEENANLQVHVEMESKEKKRLSRTNEELMWRLQTGELSPHMSPTSSPLHRPASGPGSPSRPHSYHQ